MKIAFIVFNGITWLDFLGVYEPITKLKSNALLSPIEWDICGLEKSVSDLYGLRIEVQQLEPLLSNYDIMIVPGGQGTRDLMKNSHFLDWLKTGSNTIKASVCTGSLLLGAAGFLKDRKATTHFAEYETLRPFCREVSKDRIVEDGDTITAGAVSSSIDLGLYLCSKWAGTEAEEIVRRKMDYHGQTQF